MTSKKIPVVTALLFLFLSLQVSSQTAIVLPRSTPEAEGVSSKGIIEFLDAIAKSKHELHSLMILRHGKLITEGWYRPYRPDLKHTMYSVSKSFTSTAIGFAVSEKRLSVNDKVIYFFPNQLPPNISPYLIELTVKDLLTMSAGQAPDPTFNVASMDSNWVRSFLALPILNKPGSTFLYNSLATYMLSAIVQKVTGQKVIDYLTPRLFKPLGIQGMDWETDPMGINTGGWGLRIKTEDMARFGLLYLQKGKWNGKQILPAAWIQEATSFKIDQAPDARQSQKDSSDWMQGYCYQFWRSRHNSFRGDGAFGQYILVLPEEDAVIAITSETKDMQGELNLVWQYLLPAMQADQSTLNKNDAVILRKRLASLKVRSPAEADTSFHEPAIEARRFKVESNSKNIETISFNEKNKVITLTIKTNDKTYSFNFGYGKWIEGKTTMLGPSLVEGAKNHFVGLPASQVAGSYRWKAPNVLEMQLRYIDSPHTETMTFHFDKNNVTVIIQNSFSADDRRTVLKGEGSE